MLVFSLFLLTDSLMLLVDGIVEQGPVKKRSPSDFLKSVLGRPVRVKLNSGIEYRGVLACLDGYLNIAMEQTEEYGLDGQLNAKYGDCFIRGNNVLYISAQKRKGH
jgi:U6 snRNA-associated Sm-like protein LSm6